MKHKIFLMLHVIILTAHLSDQFKRMDKKIDIKRITTKYDEDSPIKIDLVLTKFNRTHTACNVNATLEDTIDSKYRFELEVRLWSDGGWKRNYVTYGNKDPCVQLKYTLGKSWNDIIIAAKANHNCPYYPGNYKLNDFYINVDNVPVLFASGLFKVLIKVFRDKKFVVILDIDLEIRDVV